MTAKFLLAAVLLFWARANADEGMWTVDNLPKAQLKERYNFEVDDKWVEHVRLSSARLANGCSGSFISKDGLVMTNHHCARGCIEQLSTAKSDLITKGFLAQERKQERRCPAMEVNRLVEISDVTKQIKQATAGLEGKAYSDARKAKMSQLEKGCSAGDDKFRCDTVSLYHGGEYKLYKYQRYQDVRLVFAPEQSIAAFGGDPDNFNFPRYSLDMAFVRVYEDKRPLKNPHYFRWSKKSISPGEMTFITGHPGRTSRLLTIAELEYQRDVALPKYLYILSEMRGRIIQYQKKGTEFKRTSHGKLQSVENGFKALKGRVAALRDKKFFAELVKNEMALRKQVEQKSELKKYKSAWKEIEAAVEMNRNYSDEISYIAFGRYQSRLFHIARTLVRAAEEMGKPNEKRLREFTDAKIPQMKQRLLSKAPIYKDLETALLEFSFSKMREALSPDHEFVKKAFGKKSPESVAKALIKGTKLSDVKFREKLLKGGKKSILASTDPMIKFARLIDKDSRKLRKLYEEKIESVYDKNSEKIAQAKFKIYGTDTYPDATFSLRVSFGRVKGYTEKGKEIYPLTKIKGLFQRQTGSEPFVLPKSWMKSKKKLNMDVPFNFVSNNDIIGGNSGSPVINRKAEIVGLVFDGNIHSLGGAYGFDENMNRAVSVHSSVMMESLDKVYRAKSITSEIKQGGKASLN